MLPGIIVLAMIFRVWGLGFGLPFTYHPDEGALVMPALNIVQTGDFQPARLDYGSAYIYSLTGVYALYFLYGARQGYFDTVADLPVVLDYRQIGAYPFPRIFWLARLLTATMGTLTAFSA